MLAAIFYTLWCRIGLKKPGMILGFILIAYGITRFGLKSGDDNSLNIWWMLYKADISQNISIYLVLIGAVLVGIVSKMKPPAVQQKKA